MIYKVFKEKNAQGAAEMILLFGGIIIIVLIALYFYKNYLTNFSSEINSTEVNNFNNKVDNIKDYLNQ